MKDDSKTVPPTVDVFKYLLKNDLSFFIRRVFMSVSPGVTYEHNWHIDAIAHQLQRIINGENTRLIITMPPRSLKSICASVAFPAFILGRDPRKQIICVSYAQELAKKHSNDTRAVMSEPWYRNVFPQTVIDKNTEDEFSTTRHGFRLSTSVGGVLTGRGGDILIIDDPIKPQDAMSELARTRAKDWTENTLFTRLNHKETGSIITVMQRLHPDDPVGVLLEKGGWFHLNLPAIAETDEQIELGGGQTYLRKKGDLLHPARESKAAIERLRNDLGTAQFSAQYLQAPVPAAGNLVRREWFKFQGLPPFEKGDYYFVSWDTANKAKELSGYSVATVWKVQKELGTLHLAEVFRARMEYPQLKKKVIELHKECRAECTLIEDAGSGTSLIQDIRQEFQTKPNRMYVKAIRPEGDKIVRLAEVSAMIEAGYVSLPPEDQAHWVSEFLAELLAFPNSKYTDQVDSFSQALKWYKDRHRRSAYVTRAIGLMG